MSSSLCCRLACDLHPDWGQLVYTCFARARRIRYTVRFDADPNDQGLADLIKALETDVNMPHFCTFDKMSLFGNILCLAAA